ncbi:symmetrical bis(5'-nucleosyl)-tetraphosphatase [Candidatus Ishikawella capsulata]|nr:symmetrical bis(5'-nucleosyl)-tetraphosphatase [Candidatus Ishikawaella capsulata]
MNTYLVGDIHGCYEELRNLLDQVKFDPDKDILWLTGDLVSRGPHSLEVLRYLKSIQNSIKLVLGNHDIYLLTLYNNINSNIIDENFTSLLQASDIDELMQWMRHQPLLQVDEEKKLIMAHAGIPPQWNLKIAKLCASEIAKLLSNKNYTTLLNSIYNNNKCSWLDTKLNNSERMLFSINALTRMRYCDFNNNINLEFKGNPEEVSTVLKPWFLIDNMALVNYTIVFGHWSSLKGRGIPKGAIGLDTGCCLGGPLTLLHWEKKQYYLQGCLHKRRSKISKQ